MGCVNRVSSKRHNQGRTLPMPPLAPKNSQQKEQPAQINKAQKVRYVKGQKQTRFHHCHWPGCEKQVPPAMWGCYQHWMKLPKYLRDKVWAAYRSGQEVTLTPSREYLAVAREVQQWIRDNYNTTE